MRRLSDGATHDTVVMTCIPQPRRALTSLLAQKRDRDLGAARVHRIAPRRRVGRPDRICTGTTSPRQCAVGA